MRKELQIAIRGLVVMGALFSLHASANRIQRLFEKNLEQSQRESIDAATCSEGQRAALAACVTREEFDYAVRNDLLPLCIQRSLAVVLSCESSGHTREAH